METVLTTSTSSVSFVPGRLASPAIATADELRAARAVAWHTHGIVTVPLEEVSSELDRMQLTSIATRLYGKRTEASHPSTSWQEGDVMDRGDGETWTVVATVSASVVVQRRRDGALATLG